MGPALPPSAIRQPRRRITDQRSRVEAALTHQLSNARPGK
jgi:hypothetical protein